MMYSTRKEPPIYTVNLYNNSRIGKRAAQKNLEDDFESALNQK